MRIHLAKGLGFTIRYKHWIETESKIAAHGPDNLASDDTFKYLIMAVRPGQAQDASELSRSRMWRATLLKQSMDPLHRLPEVATVAGIGPIGRMDPRSALQCIDRNAAVVRQCRKLAASGRELRLYAGVSNEAGFGFRRFSQTEFTS